MAKHQGTFAAADLIRDYADEFDFGSGGVEARVAESAGRRANEAPASIVDLLETGRLGPAAEVLSTIWSSSLFDEETQSAFVKPEHAKGGSEEGGGKPSHAGGPKKDKTDTADGDSTDGGTTEGGTPDGGTTDGSTSDGSATDGSSANSPIFDYVSGLDTPSSFNISITFTGAWTDALMDAVKLAAEQISDFIIGDLPDVNGIDDFALDAQLTTIDGSGGYAGRATYSALRADSLLPYSGYIKMDEADADSLLSHGIFEELVLHEMLHSLGMGTVWKSMGLVETIGGEPRFTGANAIEAYTLEFPTAASSDAYSDQGVPLTADGFHWDEAMGKESMTPRVGESDDVTSVSLAALEDMGYETIYGGDLLVA